MFKKMVPLVIIAFMLGLCVNNFAMSGVPANYNVAVVDVAKVVSSSKQVATLKKEQQSKMEQIKKIYDNAQAQAMKEKDVKKRNEIMKKAEDSVVKIKTDNDKVYAKKLADIDKSISATIQGQAKKSGYDLVLAKGIVLYGGTDITAEVQKIVK